MPEKTIRSYSDIPSHIFILGGISTQIIKDWLWSYLRYSSLLPQSSITSCLHLYTVCAP